MNPPTEAVARTSTSRDPDGGTLLAEAFEKLGVDTVFTLHGGHLDAALIALHDRGVQLVDTRHEQAAGMAADAWARMTGRPGVALVTAGPGVTNIVSALANAFLDAVPMVVIGGAAPLREAELLPLQGGLDQIALVRPVTKWAHQITRTDRIGELIVQAFRVATSGRPGPVFLEIPIDVLFAPLGRRARVPHIARVEPASANTGAIARVAQLLIDAERPAIFAGGGAIFGAIQTSLRQLAAHTRTPVFTNRMSHGLIPSDDPLAGGKFANLVHAGRRGGDADLVIAIGAPQSMHTGGRGSPFIPAGATFVQVDIEPEELGRNRPPDIAIVAHAESFVTGLFAAVERHQFPGRDAWLTAVAEASAAATSNYADALDATSGLIHPVRLAREIARRMPPGAVLAVDGGETCRWAEMASVFAEGTRWLSPSYLGCLGVALPFAIGAKIADRERTVVCFSGDGAMGFNLPEFDTVIRHQIPLTVVVANDQQWGMSAHGQDLLFGPNRRVVSDLGLVRYDLIAKGFGWESHFVQDLTELGAALDVAVGATLPTLLNVLIDPEPATPDTIAMYGGGIDRTSNATAQRATTVLPYYENLTAIDRPTHA